MADRLAGNNSFPEDVRAAYAGEGPPVLVQSRLNDPLRVKQPATIGLQFMGDLYHDDVPFSFVRDIFDIMARCRQHRFVFLTKRPARMLEWVEEETSNCDGYLNEWNVWSGVSVENQETADRRIPLLLQMPAPVHVVSVEPMLGPVDIAHYLCGMPEPVGGSRDMVSRDMAMDAGDPKMEGMVITREPEWQQTCPPLGWAICGGESGQGARPMHPSWARSLRDQCKKAGTKFWFKQWGAWVGGTYEGTTSLAGRTAMLGGEPAVTHDWGSGVFSARVGKKRAGCLLDGREWNEMPSTG